jgi:Integrase core domain
VNSSAPGCSIFPLFNGKLRDEGPNVEVFFSLADARKKLALWREDYNQHRPIRHSTTAHRRSSQPPGSITRKQDFLRLFA